MMTSGLVASHNRSGGSLRSTAVRFTPSKVSPSSAAVPRHRGLCPPAVRAASWSEDRSATRQSRVGEAPVCKQTPTSPRAMTTGRRSHRPAMRHTTASDPAEASSSTVASDLPGVGYHRDSRLNLPAPEGAGLALVGPHTTTEVIDAESVVSTAEHSASRPCSADESVAPSHRFRQASARSFHGLCSPPRFIQSLVVPQLPSCRPHRTRRRNLGPFRRRDSIPSLSSRCAYLLSSRLKPKINEPTSPPASRVLESPSDRCRSNGPSWTSETLWGAEAESRAAPFQRRFVTPKSASSATTEAVEAQPEGWRSPSRGW
jgi:hypothetical protein